MQNIPFTTPGYDYGVDINQIERRRALSNALQQQSMSPLEQPGTPAGGFTPHASPFQGLAKIAQAYAGKRSEQKADTQQRELTRKVQGDYQSMLARGLQQLQGSPSRTIQPDPQEAQQAADQGTPQVGTVNQPAQAPNPMAAMGTFAGHPMGQQFAPMAMQAMQRQQLMAALGGAGGQPQGAPQQPQLSPMNPGGPNPSVMAGSGTNPMPPQQQPQPQPPMHMTGQGGIPNLAQQAGGATGPASGIPMEAWLATDPTGKSYLNHLADQGKTSGRVFYDQNGDAFSVAANGSPIRLPGIKQRDKMEAVNLGGETRMVNPYNQKDPLQHSLTPAQNLEIPLQQANTYFNTGMNPPSLSGNGMTPLNIPGGGGVPAGQPRPQQVAGGRPAQANPNTRLTPKQQQELEQARPHATQAATGVMNALQNAINEADKLDTQPGLSHVTGPVAGRLPNLSGTATNAQANLDTLKSQIGVQVLNAMREASRTGGAVGSVTEREWPILQNQLGSLQQSQTTAAFKENLKTVKATLQRIQNVQKNAYESSYGKMNWVPGALDQPGAADDPLNLRGQP